MDAATHLAGRRGHLHWHLAVFELGRGDVEGARSRFEQIIAPAMPRGGALTDHRLLAFAGARDVGSIERQA